MADRHRLGTFDKGGRFNTTLDAAPADGSYGPISGTFKVIPPAQTDVVSKTTRRYGGSRKNAEIHDNGQLQGSWLIKGVSQNDCLVKADALLAILEDSRTQFYWEWRPDGALYSTFFEVRGTGWDPQYNWLKFQGAQLLQIDLAINVAPLGLGAPLDIWDDFSQSQASIAFTNLLTNGSVETDLTGYVLSSPPYPASVLADSPVAYYRLSEPSGTVAADSSGGTNTGAYVGTPTLGATGPITNEPTDKAITLNGTTQYVEAPDASALRLISDLTVEAWVKPTAVNALQIFVDKRATSGSNASYALYMDGAGHLTLGIGDASTGQTNTATTATLTAGVWQHIAAKVSGTTVTLYINGAPSGSTGSIAGQARGSGGTPSPLRIGRGANSGVAFNLTGSVDEVALYNTALSDARIAAHYAAATGSTSHTGTGGETTFTVGLATLAQSAAWAASGTKSARLTVSGAVAAATTLDSPPFAVAAGASYSVRLAYNAATISAGNVALVVHWSDGSTSTITTLTGAGAGTATGTFTAPGGVTTATIRAVPSTAGTFDVSLDAVMAVAGAVVPSSYADTNIYTGGLLTDYTWDTGADTLIDYTGALVPTDTTTKRLYHSARGYVYTDAQATLKVTPGASVAATHSTGLILRRIDAQNFLWASVDDSNTLQIFKRVAGVDTQLATAGYTPTARTPFWVRFRTEANVLFAEAWNTEPTPAGTPAVSLSYTLSSTEATTFGAAVAGPAGLRLIPQNTDWAYDDFRVEPYTYRARSLPESIDLRGIPGTAPAKFDARLGVNAVTTQAWTVIGWVTKPNPHNYVWNGDFEDAALGTTGWSVAAVAGVIGAATSINRDTTAARAKYGVGSGQIATPATTDTGASFALYRKFKKGVTYTIDMYMSAGASVTAVRPKLGVSGDIGVGAAAALTTAPTLFTTTWTPTADYDVAYAAAGVNAATATTFNIDAIRVYEGTTAPTVGKHNEGKGAHSGFGVLQAESAIPSTLTGWTLQASGSTLGGNYLGVASAASASGEWFIDPALLASDEFSAEISIEVYARVGVSSAAGGVTAVLTAIPENNAASRVPTNEWGSAGVGLILPSAGVQWRIVKLGTLTLPVDQTNASRWRIKLALTNVTNAELDLDYLFLVPARQRAAGPTSKVNDSSYPAFFHSGAVEEAKTIRSDLSGLYQLPPGPAARDGGLCGQLLELAPGDSTVMVKTSNLVPDDPTSNSTGDSPLSPSVSLHFPVQPRYQLARSG